MITYKSNIDNLETRCQNLVYKRDDTGTLMAVSQGKWLPGFEDVVSEIMRYRGAGALYTMCNIIPPGTRVPIHRDWLPGHRCLERWHLVVSSTDGCGWWDSLNGRVTMTARNWYGPCPYWLEHSVWNMGFSNRVHLIVDLDVDVAGARYQEPGS